MKTQLVVLAVWMTFLAPLLAGGPQTRIAVGARSGWYPPPVRPVCAPVVYRSYPVWYEFPQVAWWGPTVLVSSSGSGFRTISPLMDFSTDTPVYRVPGPILPAQPVTVHSTRFGWRP